MSTILKRIGELLRFKQPKQAAMAKMTEMERMPETGQMTEMEQQEHHSEDMASMPGEMKMSQVQSDRNIERR